MRRDSASPSIHTHLSAASAAFTSAEASRNASATVPQIAVYARLSPLASSSSKALCGWWCAKMCEYEF